MSIIKVPYRVRNAAADIFAMVVFGFITGMMIEIFISGMSFEQSLASRTLSIPIAWPYGMFRDYVIGWGRKLSPTRWMKGLSDMVAYVVFQSPIYACILLVVGANKEQIIAAVMSNILVSGALGVVYGQFLELCRRMFRVTVNTQPLI